jgi:predicted site-specific integrase-resolvase
MDDKSPQDKLVDDLMSIIASFSGKLYGGKNRIVEDKI